MYGVNNFWNWLRYWVLDTEQMVTLLLIDKGYYDYDYEYEEKVITAEKTILSDEKIESISKRFGFGGKVDKTLKEVSAEELQSHAMKDINN